MAVRFFLALAAGLALAGCGGNPLGKTEEPAPIEPIPDPPPDIPDDFIPKEAVAGSVEGVGLKDWAADAPTIRVSMDAQVLPELTGDFTRDTAFDVTRDGHTYYGYSYQSSVENRKAVVLVRASGGASAASAMEPGQFANGRPDMYHSGSALYRADVYRAPRGGLFNYTGSYAGLLNVGPAAGTPPGSLPPTEPYRTSGTSLITADFTRMKVSGGVTGRKVEDALPSGASVPADLPDIALWTTGITADGDFSGVVYRGDNAPAADPLDQDWKAAGRYDGIFAGIAASDVAVVMLFDPIGNGRVWEQGTIVGPCTRSSGGSC